MKNIKWEDLKFKHHRSVPKNIFGVECYIKFKNGHWCSIIGGAENSRYTDWFRGNGINTFEIMSSSTEKTKIGVKGWLTKKQVLRHLNYLNNK